MGMMLLDEVADLGALADTTATLVEDHSRQLGELLVMMQMMQEMMGAQQEQLMAAEVALRDWSLCLTAREATVNECLVWLREQVLSIRGDEEEEEDEGEDEDDEAMTSTEVDEGSPVVLDSDLDDFGSPELRPTLER